MEKLERAGEGAGGGLDGGGVGFGGAKGTFTDRSRTITYQRCPRKRYIEYHAGPNRTGLVPDRLDLNLLTGGAYHEGVERLLTGHGEEVAVETALKVYDAGAGRAELPDGADGLEYSIAESRAQVEGLVRVYARWVLPQILERFVVVETEREEKEDLGSGITWLARLDSLLLEKDSNDLYVCSEKTTKEWNKRASDAAETDMQGLSETWTVNQRLQRWQKLLSKAGRGTPEGMIIAGETVPRWFLDRASTGALPIALGVKMQFALKGRYSAWPEGSWKKYQSALIRPWKNEADLGKGEGYGWAWKYEFQDELGGNHRLGKGWKRVNIWEEEIGVKGWVDLLCSGLVQPDLGFPLESFFVLPNEYMRHEEDINQWRLETEEQERKIQTGLYELAANPALTVLGQHFPMYRHSCVYPNKCQYYDICYGNSAYWLRPELAGGLKERVPNHPAEGGEGLADTALYDGE